MKRNSGSALTSVIVIFLLVTMIGVPLLSMVVYNYQMREYDSGIKEAEYKNEIIMDRISTIIRSEVITALSNAKNTSTEGISAITDILVNSYNFAYDTAYENIVAQYAQYDSNGNIINKSEIAEKVEEEIRNSLKDNLEDKASDNSIDYGSVLATDIVDILEFGEDISNAQINEERLQDVCNQIFKERYQKALVDSLFPAIYGELKYNDLGITGVAYGKEEIKKDEDTGKTAANFLRVASKYIRDADAEGGYRYTWGKTGAEGGNLPYFDINDQLYVGIESNYKSGARVPLTTLSATFIISTPDFNAISAIEQQTIALSNPVLDYGVIVGKTLKLKNGSTIIDGNVLTRANGITTKIVDDEEIVEADGIIINSGASFELALASDTTIPSDGMLATPGDIIMNKNSTLKTGKNPTYYRNLYLGDPNNQQSDGEIEVVFNGDVLAKDDLEVNLNSKVTVKQTSGSYFGYNDVNNDGPDSSSAIVINSTAITGINITLKNLYLTGRAFIDGVKSANLADKNNNPLIYKTGESISVKGNYIAYQTPLINTNNYAKDGVVTNYDVDKVMFSPYFMSSEKAGIEGSTNINLNLADNFSDEVLKEMFLKTGRSNTEAEYKKFKNEMYKNFDTQSKWEYFKEYALKNTIKKPTIEIDEIKYIEGVGLNNGNVVDRVYNETAKAVTISKEKRFEEFTSCFGYYPEDESKRKNNISDWIKFNNEKYAEDEDFYVYISKKNAGNKTLSWGTSSSGSDIDIVTSDVNGATGLIIHDGDLTIKNCDESIPFIGMIIVTGNLTIEGDVKIISDKEVISNVIIQNYLGVDGYTGNMLSGELNEGDLFDSFTYDGSGTTYIAIDVTDRSNTIDINDLIGITDWKKQGYGRL